MFKTGGFYLTLKGQLVKVFDNFKFADGYTLNAAVYNAGTGWVAVRYAADGRCNNGDGNFTIVAGETFHKYRNYLTFNVQYDRQTSSWCGSAKNPYGTIIVSLTNIESPERALHLLQLGSEQKLLTWMHEAGYDEENKEVV